MTTLTEVQADVLRTAERDGHCMATLPGPLLVCRELTTAGLLEKESPARYVLTDAGRAAIAALAP